MPKILLLIYILYFFQSEQFIMAYGGLRGAVGFSLVTILPDDFVFKKLFQTTTLLMIFFTVFVQGDY